MAAKKAEGRLSGRAGRTSLGQALGSMLRGLGGSDPQAARAQRVAEVHVRWKCAVEAVYREAASLVLDHVNAVYIVSPDKTEDPVAARVGQGRTLLVVYADDAMVRSDIDARQEFLKMKLNEQGERVDVFSIKASRRDMLRRHPYRDEKPLSSQPASKASRPEPQITASAAARLKEQAASVEPAALRESILKALDANSKPF